MVDIKSSKPPTQHTHWNDETNNGRDSLSMQRDPTNELHDKGEEPTSCQSGRKVSVQPSPLCVMGDPVGGGMVEAKASIQDIALAPALEAAVADISSQFPQGPSDGRTARDDNVDTPQRSELKPATFDMVGNAGEALEPAESLTQLEIRQVHGRPEYSTKGATHNTHGSTE